MPCHPDRVRRNYEGTHDGSSLSTAVVFARGELLDIRRAMLKIAEKYRSSDFEWYTDIAEKCMNGVREIDRNGHR